MHELEEVRRFRAELSPAEEDPRTARARLSAAIDAELDSPTGRERPSGHPVRSWLPAAGLAAACLAALAVGVGLSSDGGSTESQSRDSGESSVVYGDALLEFASETATDVVAHADQVSVVTAVSSEPVVEKAPAEQIAAGEGLTMRRMTFEVDRSLWHRDGAPRINGTFTSIVTGWVEHESERARFGLQGTPWFEEGSRYMMPLTMRDGRWTPDLPTAVFPVAGSTVKVAPTQETPLARQVNEESLAEVSGLLESAAAKAEE